MDFLTAYYAQKGVGEVSLLLQQYEWRGRHLCFACITEAEDGKAAAYLSEQLLHWLRGQTERTMTELVKGKKDMAVLAEQLKRVVGRADEELRYSGLTEAGKAVSFAGALCQDDSFVMIQRGKLRSYLLNTSFGKAYLQDLSGKWALPDGEDALVEYGVLQGEVGLLFATESFCELVSERKLREGMGIAGMQTESQVEKHLEELGAEGERLGGNGLAAIAVVVKDDKHVVKSGRERRSAGGTKGKALGCVRRKKRNSPQCVERPQRGNAGEDAEAASLSEMLQERGYMCYGLLGRGAFAAVYKVKEWRTGRFFACKVSEYKELLNNEFRNLKELRHPLFPQVYDYWEKDDVGIMRMEYIAGEGLDEMLARRKRFSVRQIARIGMELAEGLLYLHESENALLFRDIKPENIVVTQNGRVKLLDFGCVCEQGSERKTKAGSPGFAAPEQLAGEATGVTGDVYGLGQTLRVLRGEGVRGKAGSTRACGRFRMRRRPAQKGAGRYLDRVLEACVQEEAEKRLPDMRSVMCALMPLCEEKSIGRFKPKKKADPEWGKIRCRKNIWKSLYKRA